MPRILGIHHFHTRTVNGGHIHDGNILSTKKGAFGGFDDDNDGHT